MLPSVHSSPGGQAATSVSPGGAAGNPAIYVQRVGNGFVYRLNPTPSAAPWSDQCRAPQCATIDPAMVADWLNRASTARLATFIGGIFRFVRWWLRSLNPNVLFAFFFENLLRLLARQVESRLPTRFGLYYDADDDTLDSFFRKVRDASLALRASCFVESWIRGGVEGQLAVPYLDSTDFPFTSNIVPPSWQIQRTLLVFLPDRLGIVDGDKVDFRSYDQVTCTCSTVDVPYVGTIPSDATVVGQTWRHMTRSGTPDRRFRDNPVTTNVRHGLLHICAGNLVAATVRVSNLAAAKHAGDALTAALRIHEANSLTKQMSDSAPASFPAVPAFSARPATPPVVPEAPTFNTPLALTPGVRAMPASNASRDRVKPIEELDVVMSFTGYDDPTLAPPGAIPISSRLLPDPPTDDPPQVAPGVAGRSFALPRPPVLPVAAPAPRWVSPDEMVEVHGIPLQVDSGGVSNPPAAHHASEAVASVPQSHAPNSHIEQVLASPPVTTAVPAPYTPPDRMRPIEERRVVTSLAGRDDPTCAPPGEPPMPSGLLPNTPLDDPPQVAQRVAERSFALPRPPDIPVATEMPCRVSPDEAVEVYGIPTRGGPTRVSNLAAAHRAGQALASLLWNHAANTLINQVLAAPPALPPAVPPFNARAAILPVAPAEPRLNAPPLSRPIAPASNTSPDRVMPFEEREVAVSGTGYDDLTLAPSSTRPMPSRSLSDALPDDPPQVAPREVGRSFSLPRPPDVLVTIPTTRWVGPDETVEVHGIPIRGGLFYLGEQSHLAGGSTEPSLVSASLPISWAHDPDKAPLDSWPAYQRLSPERRRRYLEWLSTGRRDPTVEIGFVFIFFYGLERRVFIDGDRTSQDVATIRAELAALLETYTTSSSFRHYAWAFFDALNVLASDGLPTRMRSVLYDGGVLPLWIRTEFAWRARQKASIDGPLALTWFDAARMSPAPTVRSRCGDEFAALFAQLFRERWGDGIVLPPVKARLAATYRPASNAFRSSVEIDTRDLSDVTSGPRATRLLDEIETVVKKCAADLDVYSRWLGRHPEGRGALAGLALLPPVLRTSLRSDGQKALVVRLEGWINGKETTVVAVRDIITGAGITIAAKPSKAEAVVLPQVLHSLGFGIEPDVRFGGPALSARSEAVLFRLATGSSDAPSPEYPKALIFARLAAMMGASAGALDDDARRHVEAHIRSMAGLGVGEAVRAGAHLQWLLHSPPSPASIKKSLVGVSEATRQSLASFLIGIAGADGRIEPMEVNALRRLFPVLGLDKDLVYSHLHAMAAQAPGSVPPPAPGRRKNSSVSATPSSAPEGIVVLDMERLQSTLCQTAAVTELLGAVFDGAEDERELRESSIPPPVSLSPISEASSVSGLDVAHSALLRVLGRRSSWTRAEIAGEAARLSLMPEGAIEVLNERALDRCGNPLFDGNDPMDVDVEIARELMDA